MINYPNSKKKYTKSTSQTTQQRGMSLEEDLNRTNDYYRFKDLAVVHKKPTPIQIVSVDYPSRNRAKITEAYFRQASTTDYFGVYKGYALDFEAKETKNKTLFPLTLLHDHQYDHLVHVTKHGALAFLIIRFYTLNETYLLLAKDLIQYRMEHTVRSLPISWIRSMGYEVHAHYQIPCDYLKVIDHIVKESL